MKKRVVALTLLIAVMGISILRAQDFWVRSHAPSPGRVMALSLTRNGHLVAGRQGEMGIGGSVLRSSDNGGSWVEVNSGLLDTNVVSLLVTRDGTILAGMSAWFGQPGVCLYRSTDEGNSWSRSDNGLAGVGQAVALAEDSTGDLFCIAETGLAGSVRGLFFSTDGGVSWNLTATPLPWNGPNGLLVNREGTLFAAAFSGVYRSSDKGGTWDTLNNGLNALPLVTSLAAMPDGVLFAGMGYGGGVYRSGDGGESWVNTGLNSGDVRALVATPGGVLFVGTQGKGVFWSSDTGHSWQQDNSGLPGLWVWSLLFTRDGHLFAGTDSGSIFRTTQPLTSIDPGGVEIPRAYILCQNYPNPFNPSTTIRYGLPERSRVTLSVFNILGQQLAEILRGEEESGYHEVRFDASGLASGVYFYRLEAGEFIQTRRFVLVR
jgi:photosystem II stability/assembly factor-like uncharacterized protein